MIEAATLDEAERLAVSQITGIVKFLERLRVVPSIHGPVWRHNMAVYYSTRLQNMIATLPEAFLPKLGPELARRITTVLEWCHQETQERVGAKSGPPTAPPAGGKRA